AGAAGVSAARALLAVCRAVGDAERRGARAAASRAARRAVRAARSAVFDLAGVSRVRGRAVRAGRRTGEGVRRVSGVPERGRADAPRAVLSRYPRARSARPVSAGGRRAGQRRAGRRSTGAVRARTVAAARVVPDPVRRRDGKRSGVPRGGRGPAPDAPVPFGCVGLAGLGDVAGLRSLGALDDLELDLLALLERPEAGSLDRGEVHEDVVAPLALDEPVALRVIEPLDLTGDAHTTCLPCEDVRWSSPHRSPVVSIASATGDKKRPREAAVLTQPRRRPAQRQRATIHMTCMTVKVSRRGGWRGGWRWFGRPEGSAASRP